MHIRVLINTRLLALFDIWGRARMGGANATESAQVQAPKGAFVQPYMAVILNLFPAHAARIE